MSTTAPEGDVTMTCGGDVSKGRIKYPGTGTYKKDEHCVWNIKKQGWHKIVFEKFRTNKAW